MKTQEEINELKRQWEKDPCWDIEDTEGFEDHARDLLAYREQKESEWEKQKMEDYCFWVEIVSDCYWEAECNKEGFAFNEGSPTDNGFMFCPYCGRKMKENRQTTQEEED